MVLAYHVQPCFWSVCIVYLSHFTVQRCYFICNFPFSIHSVAPQIQKAPVNGSFPRGSIGFFSCFPDPSSVPHPTVTWYKDNAELVVPSDSTKYFVNLRSGRLFISDVTDSDNGDYHCRLQ